MSVPDPLHTFFDTSVLFYLLSDDARKADRVEQLLAQRGIISVQVLNEFAAVAMRKLRLPLAEIREILDTVEPPVFTCEAVVSEACFLLNRIAGGQDAVLELLAGHVIETDFQLSDEIAAVRSLMKKFATVPMAFADACLVRMSELQSKRVILTLDSDFRVYRRNRRQVIPVITPGGTHGV